MTLKNQPILWRHACLFDNIGQNETATPKNCQFLWRRVMTRGQITLEMVIMSVAGQDDHICNFIGTKTPVFRANDHRKTNQRHRIAMILCL